MRTTVRDLLGKLNDIFDRRTKQKLILASVMSIAIALLDTIAIALVLPLVNLATGAADDAGSAGFVSRLLGDPEPQTLTLILTIVVVALFILKDLGAMAYTWWMAGFKAINRVDLSSRLLRHFLTSPFTVVARRSSSEMIRTMNDAVTQVFGTTVYGLMGMVSNVTSIAAILTALLISAPVPTLVVAVYFGLAALLYLRVVKPRATAAGVVASEAARDAWRTALAALGGIKELNLRGTQEHFVRNYRDAAMRGARAGRTAEFISGMPRYLLEILFIVAVGIILVVGISTSGQDATAGGTIGVLAMFVAAGFRVLPSVTGLLGNIGGLRFGARYLDIVHTEVTEARRIEERHEEDGPPITFAEALRVEKVSFRYPDGSADVLSGVTLTVPHGNSVALVGGSGAGKTTLVDIMLGLHDPTSGRVAVDGADIAGRKRRWQGGIGYVPQDVYLLDATLAENIAFDQDRSAIDRELLASAIAQAQLDELVSELPNGIDTPIGEKGSRLSGGQRQRVGIARALYRRPHLLVLDEATSALDNETEHRIGETITALHGSITVVIVAHRLSTVRDCDSIAFMKVGRIECTGTFEEVRASNAEFARLVTLGSLEPLDDSRPDDHRSAQEPGERVTSPSEMPGHAF
ncbi:ABC transporter ATP-binding protein [Georgenia sp. M64]|uniref:ABC transporter ATP-binding protein n=1 Tax=Georgenia sp. M64 TaxID=3120520 RepID=UPI0030DF1C14